MMLFPDLETTPDFLTMRLSGLLTLSLMFVPAAVSARDVAGCAVLYRKLAAAPQVIGSNANVRRYAQELSRQNQDIRNLRIEMRRAGCAGGSIVTLGGPPPGGQCGEMQKMLSTFETSRDTLTAERDSARQLNPPSSERGMILASIRQNSCLPSDLQEQLQQERRVQGIDIPQDKPNSGITTLRGARQVVQKIDPTTPPPERPYDPTKKVRMVGPIFLPDVSIDLAHPASKGPQRVD